MNSLPEPQQPTATAAGQPTPEVRRMAADLAAAVDSVYVTSFRDPSPVPAIGNALPVPQPGRPPMSSKATDDSARMISAGFLTLCAGSATSGVLYFSGQADPMVIGLIAAIPVSLAIPVIALSRLVKRAKEAAPDVHHHHYNGPVDQRTLHTNTRGVWAKTRNELDR